MDYQPTCASGRMTVHYATQCPFCGCNKAMTWHIGHYDKPWVVECMDCSAQGPHAETEEEAIRLWNRRYINGMTFALSNVYPKEGEE